jgi:thymidine phosphorylase
VVDAVHPAVSSPTSRCRPLAMAILLRGMTPAEIARWTAAMIAMRGAA